MSGWTRALTGLLIAGGAFSPARARGQEAVTRGGGSPQGAQVRVELRAEDGEPVTGATLLLYGPLVPDRATVPAPLRLHESGVGRYSGSSLESGRYRLQVSALGYESAVLKLSVRPNEDSFQRVVLAVTPVELTRVLASGRPAVEAPAAGHSISRVDFTEQAVSVRSVGEWLSLQPGASVRQFGTGGRQVIGVRGSRPEGVLVLVDGVPINDPVSGAADLSSIPVATLQSASLVRGTSSARFGSGATGGVLLLRTRTPSGRTWSAAVEAGSHGYRAADAFFSFAGPAGQLGLFLRRESAENNYGFRNRMLPGEPTERRSNADASGLHSTLSLKPAAVPLQAQIRFDDGERGVPGRMGTRLFEKARWYDRTFQAAMQLGRSGRPSAAAGMRLQRLHYDPANGQPAATTRISTFNLTATMPRLAPVGVVFLGRVEREAVSGQAFAGAPSRWTGGVAATRPFTFPRLVVQPSLALDAAPGQTAWSPELAVSMQPGSRLLAWARVGRGFRLPTFADLYFGSAYRINPDPSLTAETVAFDGELGGRWGGLATDALQAEVALFRRVTRNPIVWLASAAAVWSPRNLDRLESTGIEIVTSVRSPSGGWRAGAEATVAHSRLGFGDNRNPLPYEPRVAGSVLLERTEPAWAARVEVKYTGPRTTSVAATRRLPGFVQVDLGARTRIELGSVALVLQGRVLNLFDRRYEFVELFPEPGRRVEFGVEGP